MSSRRRGNRRRSPHRANDRRDRSPSRGNPGPPSSHRGYRERDDYGRYDYHDDGRHQRDYDDGYPSQGQITGRNPNVTVHNYNYVPAPPPGAQIGSRDGRGNARRRNEDRGRRRQSRPRGSSQASQTSRGFMPPPAPRGSLEPRPTGQRDSLSRVQAERSPRSDQLKPTIPEKLRGTCGACTKDHDIRYCPEPNTNDGRTKICPVCDTSNHAWYQCDYYDAKDTWLQWIVLWANRQLLPAMVHDSSLNDVFSATINLEDASKSIDERVAAPNNKAGPLSPNFVMRLMPPKTNDDEVQKQLTDGRQLPWQLERKDLESKMRRLDKAIEDPVTREMQVWKQIKGTKTDLAPTARKLDYFRELDQKTREDEQNALENSEIYKQMKGLKWGRKSMTARRNRPREIIWALPQGKFAKPDEMAVLCRNCGTKGHDAPDCPSPCQDCGWSMQEHMDAANQCTSGCLCRDHAGHAKYACDRLCRLCLIENPKSITPLKDCKKYCHHHVCNIEDMAQHACCVLLNQCLQCHGRHWRQDCPQWLKTICPLQSCRNCGCERHCNTCGGATAERILHLFPEGWDTDSATERRLYFLVNKWHAYLHANQWIRVDVPSEDIGKDAWSMLQCREHPQTEVTVESLEGLRMTAWRLATGHMQKGHEEGDLDKAIGVLALPECPTCFEIAYKPGSGNYEERQPGVSKDWASEFRAAS